MESTGKYYIPVYNILESHISNIVVANPKWVRAVKGEKDDDKDAKWIADLFKLGIVKSSFIPQKDFRILRKLTRYKYKLVNMRSRKRTVIRMLLLLVIVNWIWSSLMFSANPHLISSTLFYQIIHTQMKIFFQNFT